MKLGGIMRILGLITKYAAIAVAIYEGLVTVKTKLEESGLFNDENGTNDGE